MTTTLPLISLPDSVPESLPPQHFQVGNWVYWHRVPNPDFGRIIGVIYTDAASCTITGLHYLILLDVNSPSHTITNWDFAFSEDIRLLDECNLRKLRGKCD